MLWYVAYCYVTTMWFPCIAERRSNRKPKTTTPKSAAIQESYLRTAKKVNHNPPEYNYTITRKSSEIIYLPHTMATENTSLVQQADRELLAFNLIYLIFSLSHGPAKGSTNSSNNLFVDLMRKLRFGIDFPFCCSNYLKFLRQNIRVFFNHEWQ